MEFNKGILNKLNEGFANGFSLDVQYYLFHQEKMGSRVFKNTEGDLFLVKLYFDSRKRPYCRVQACKESEKFYISSGPTKTIILGEPQQRKNFNLLKKLSAEITDEKLEIWAKELPNEDLNILC